MISSARPARRRAGSRGAGALRRCATVRGQQRCGSRSTTRCSAPAVASLPALELARGGLELLVLTPVEVNAIARAASSEQEAAIVTVAAFTGLRLGELRALRWRDVDFAKQTILVRGSFTHGMPGPPKSGRVRSVPLIDHVARALGALSRRERFTEPDDLVFSTPLGEHLSDDQFRDRFYDALEAAGLGDKRQGHTRSTSTTSPRRRRRTSSRSWWRRPPAPKACPQPCPELPRTERK